MPDMYECPKCDPAAMGQLCSYHLRGEYVAMTAAPARLFVSLPTQAILTANALKNAAAIPGLDPAMAAVFHDHSTDLMNAAIAHIRAAEAEVVELGSSTRLELAKHGVSIEDFPEVTDLPGISRARAAADGRRGQRRSR